ncbi:MAG: hypothetical protein R2867_34970 [Caldilineaceae bacterium]
MTLSPGDSAGMAVHPSSGAVTIQPNSWQWYIFRSQVPVNVDSEGNDIVDGTVKADIDATLNVQAGTVDFEVWSADDLNNWYDSSSFDPLGAGTENEFMNGDPLFWQGSFEANNNYYLIVMNSSSQAATYTLDITGDVRFPSDLALDSAMPAMAATTEQPVMSTGEMALTVDMPAENAMTPMESTTETSQSTTMGSGPESTLMPVGGYVTIAPNSWQWYSFRSQVPVEVDSDGNDIVTNPADATINALLRTRTGNVDFEVWSADNLNNWRNSSDFDPMGAGTTNEFISGDPLFWQGSFPTNNVYYLIVMNRSSQPATYSLDITGNVSFPSAATLAVQ